MKKWLVRTLKAVICLLLLAACLDIGLQVLSRTQWFTNRIENALTGTLGREIELGRMGANLRGVFIENVKIAEKGGFEQGIFVQAKRLRVHISLLHLLRGHTKIQLVLLSDAQLRLTLYADGSASWEDLTGNTSASTDDSQNADNTTPLNITANHIRLERLHLIYTDKQASREFNISGLTLDVKNFSLNQEFPLILVTDFYHREANLERKIPLTLKATVNLHRLDLEQAYASIHALKAFYNRSSLTLRGKIINFLQPQADVKLTLRNFSSDLLDGIVSLPPFTLPEAQAAVKLTANPQQQTLTLHHASLQAPGIELTGKGGVFYKEPFKYEGTAGIHLTLGEIGRWFTALAEPYRLIGTVESQITATQDRATAHIVFQEIGALIPQAGRLANINGQITAAETMDFKTGNVQVDINGKLNANPFKLNLSTHQTPQHIDVTLQAYAKELVLPPLTHTEPTESAPDTDEKTAWPLPPIHLKTDIQLEDVDVPYFTGKEVVFTSDLEGITPDLTQAHGTLHLTTAEGKIQDIYKLTDANPLTKVLFLSLNVTGKVFNSLNVLGVLNSLGSSIISAVTSDDEQKPETVKTQTILGPDGEPLEVIVPDSDKKVSGEMQYDKFDTEVNFVRGLATVKKGTFVSPMMSFRLDGNADFNSGNLDMIVHAAPGRHEVDGMMPLTLKIDGTVDNPKGSMQMLGSVTSLVTQSVTNNVVSRNVTKGVKGLFGLFKKNDTKTPSEK